MFTMNLAKLSLGPMTRFLSKNNIQNNNKGIALTHKAMATGSNRPIATCLETLHWIACSSSSGSSMWDITSFAIAAAGYTSQLTWFHVSFFCFIQSLNFGGECFGNKNMYQTVITALQQTTKRYIREAYACISTNMWPSGESKNLNKTMEISWPLSIFGPKPISNDPS